MRANARHRLLNLAHSALLVLSIAVTTWLAIGSVAPDAVALGVMAALVVGLLLAPRAPKDVLLRMYDARRIDARTLPDAVEMLAALSERANLPRPPTLYYIPSAAPNAFAIGSRSDSAIGVSDALLRILNRRELAGVLAHEVSHIAHNDLWIMGLADALTRATSVISYIGQVLLVATLPFLLLGQPIMPWWAPLVLVVSPTIVSLLQLALSRTREFDADRGGAQLSGDPMALASALTKLERRRGRFWEEILLPGRRIPEPSLLRTHPPTPERVARLRAYATEHPELQPLAQPKAVALPQGLRLVRRPPQPHWTGLWY